jgi:hypothetical protein
MADLAGERAKSAAWEREYRAKAGEAALAWVVAGVLTVLAAAGWGGRQHMDISRAAAQSALSAGKLKMVGFQTINTITNRGPAMTRAPLRVRAAAG